MQLLLLFPQAYCLRSIYWLPAAYSATFVLTSCLDFNTFIWVFRFWVLNEYKMKKNYRCKRRLRRDLNLQIAT